MTRCDREPQYAFRPQPMTPWVAPTDGERRPARRSGHASHVTRSILKGVVAAALLIAACLAFAAAGPARAARDPAIPPSSPSSLAGVA